MKIIVSGLSATTHVYGPSRSRPHQEIRETGQTPDSVEISEEAKSLSKSEEGDKTNLSSQNELGKEEEKEVQELRKKDREVKGHEMAHVAAGGGLVRGAPRYEYQTGPDGKRYAVAGHVNIDTGAEKDPEKTLKKMQQVKRAALAPANPSGQDLAVAAKASRTASEARSDLAKENIEEATEKGQSEDPSSPENEAVVQDNPYQSPVTGTTFSVTI